MNCSTRYHGTVIGSGTLNFNIKIYIHFLEGCSSTALRLNPRLFCALTRRSGNSWCAKQFGIEAMRHSGTSNCFDTFCIRRHHLKDSACLIRSLEQPRIRIASSAKRAFVAQRQDLPKQQDILIVRASTCIVYEFMPCTSLHHLSQETRLREAWSRQRTSILDTAVPHNRLQSPSVIS